MPSRGCDLRCELCDGVMESILCTVVFCTRQLSPAGAPGESSSSRRWKNQRRFSRQNDRGTEGDGERTCCASDLGPWSWKGCGTIVVESSGEPAVDVLRSVLSL